MKQKAPVKKKTKRKVTSREKVGILESGRSRPRSRASFHSHGSRGMRSRTVYYSMGMGSFVFGIALLGFMSFDLSRHESSQKNIARMQRLQQENEDPLYQARQSNLTTSSTAPNMAKAEGGDSRQRRPVEVLVGEFKDTEAFDFQEKIGYWSSFLENNLAGRKKIEGLVENYKIEDFAPLVPKKYNCTTYVETVMALSRSRSSSYFIPNLLAIRYRDGQNDFINRNHFPELDWIPNNEKAQILKDITQQVASAMGVPVKVESKKIDRSKWLQAQLKHRRGSRILASRQNWDPPVEVRVPYIDISSFKKMMNEIPSGTVINLVRRNDQRHPLLIAHQGFLIHEGNRVFLRHASPDGRIRTSDLRTYLRDQMQNYTGSWSLIGVNLNQINDSISLSSFRKEAM